MLHAPELVATEPRRASPITPIPCTKMGYLRTWWAALLLALPALAQTPAQAPAVDTKVAKELEQLEQRIADERKGWMQFMLQAATEEERAELIQAFPRDEFVGELTALAERAKGTDVAARAWLDVYTMACQLSDRGLFAQALERLLTDHMSSGYMNLLALDLTYITPPWARPQAQDALRKILAGTKSRDIRANALVQLALSAGLDETLGEKGRAEAETLLAAIEAEYGSEDMGGMTGKQFADGARNEIQNLRVGQVAPDFELSDQDGVRFKLSDYRGRVVLLDFWGFV